MSDNKFLRPEVINMLDRKRRIDQQAEQLSQLERNMIEKDKIITTYLQAQDRKMRNVTETVLTVGAKGQDLEARVQNMYWFSVISTIITVGLFVAKFLIG